jgi:hypothetical protein
MFPPYYADTVQITIFMQGLCRYREKILIIKIVNAVNKRTIIWKKIPSRFWGSLLHLSDLALLAPISMSMCLQINLERLPNTLEVICKVSESYLNSFL